MAGMQGFAWVFVLFTGQCFQADAFKARTSRFSGILCRVNRDKEMASNADYVHYTPEVRILGDGHSRMLYFPKNDAAWYETEVNCLSTPPDCPIVQSSRDAPDCREIEGCACEQGGQQVLSQYVSMELQTITDLCNVAAETEQVRMLVIGFGGGSLSQNLANACGPRLKLENIDLDPLTFELATKFFGFKETANNTMEVKDGLSALQERPSATYDHVFVDCFEHGPKIPHGCRSEEFLAEGRRVLKPTGFMTQNMYIDSNDEPVHRRVMHALSAYRSVFGGLEVNGADEGGVPLDVHARRAMEEGGHFEHSGSVLVVARKAW